MWVDDASSLILLKTSDKSLHLIQNKTKLWTQNYGLASIAQIIPHADNLLVSLNNN
jgi:hypothetical protein